MQNTTSIDVVLLCSLCSEETLHKITYSGTRIASAECLQCGRKISFWHEVAQPSECVDTHHISWRHLDGIYTQEFIHRILTKPVRMDDEFRKDLSMFLVTLPLRLLTKPWRMLQEIFLEPDDAPNDNR